MKNLVVKGARQHNLQNISVTLPRDKLTVITGVSGSGKSTLAFDTIYAEGQRRYVESLSAYARQFLGQMDKPEVDLIEGLSPSISIDQKTTWLLSTTAKSLIGWDNYRWYLDMPVCFWRDLSQYKNWEWKWDYDYDKLDALFKTWWDYCEFVMDLTIGERWFSEVDIVDIIEHCSNDDEWNWTKKNDLSLRLNYKLSELCWLYDLWDNYLIKKYSLFPNLLKND